MTKTKQCREGMFRIKGGSENSHINIGKDHVEVATALFGMGIIYGERGDIQRAMDCYEASLNIRSRKLGSSSVEIAEVYTQ